MGSEATGKSATRPRHRIGIVAQLAGLPVATLRVWERRYDVVSPRRSPSGQRLYSDRDVTRIALLKSLADRGHAIGLIARLDLAELERLATRHLEARAIPHAQSKKSARTRVVIVGNVLARRIRHCLTTLQQDHLIEPVVYENMTEAFAGRPPHPADSLILDLPSLHPDDAERIFALRLSLGVSAVTVVYSFAASETIEILQRANVSTRREPLAKSALWAMLNDLLDVPPIRTTGPDVAGLSGARHYPDEVLADMAHASVTLACECPRHLADIVMQLSAFERYSSECMLRTPSDAVLHSYLASVSARARELFEFALQRLEQEERWVPEKGAKRRRAPPAAGND